MSCKFVFLKKITKLKFGSDLFFLVYSARWIGNHGFSIGINDVQPGNVLNKEKKLTIDKEYGQCTDYIESYKSGRLELLPGCNIAETLEAKITQTLNNIRETTASVRGSDFCDFIMTTNLVTVRYPKMFEFFCTVQMLVILLASCSCKSRYHYRILQVLPGLVAAKFCPFQTVPPICTPCFNVFLPTE